MRKYRVLQKELCGHFKFFVYFTELNFFNEGVWEKNRIYSLIFPIKNQQRNRVVCFISAI